MKQTITRVQMNAKNILSSPSSVIALGLSDEGRAFFSLRALSEDADSRATRESVSCKEQRLMQAPSDILSGQNGRR
jgi:hypothetical protein